MIHHPGCAAIFQLTYWHSIPRSQLDLVPALAGIPTCQTRRPSDTRVTQASKHRDGGSRAHGRIAIPRLVFHKEQAVSRTSRVLLSSPARNLPSRVLPVFVYIGSSAIVYYIHLALLGIRDLRLDWRHSEDFHIARC